jgi:serine protease inhibitor
MRKRTHIPMTGTPMIALLAAAMALIGCGGGSQSTAQSPSGGPSMSGTTPAAVIQAQKAVTPVDPAIVIADNSFGLSLLDTLLPNSDGGNIAISPLSVALALQVLYNGSAGTTQQAMAQSLELGNLTDQGLNSDNAALQASLINPDPKVQLTIANSLWIDQSGGDVLPSFTQTDETYYGATLGDLAGAPANVNAWVDSETHGLITQLMPPVQYQGAIIANVLYFKGQWTTSFDASDTVRLPYGQGRLSMLIVLPDTGADVTNFVASIKIDDLNGLIAQLQPSTVTIALPRFTAAYGTSLSGALASMGMRIAFGSSANFSALAPGFAVVHWYPDEPR